MIMNYDSQDPKGLCSNLGDLVGRGHVLTIPLPSGLDKFSSLLTVLGHMELTSSQVVSIGHQKAI